MTSINRPVIPSCLTDKVSFVIGHHSQISTDPKIWVRLEPFSASSKSPSPIRPKLFTRSVITHLDDNTTDCDRMHTDDVRLLADLLSEMHKLHPRVV